MKQKKHMRNLVQKVIHFLNDLKILGYTYLDLIKNSKITNNKLIPFFPNEPHSDELSKLFFAFVKVGN